MKKLVLLVLGLFLMLNFVIYSQPMPGRNGLGPKANAPKKLLKLTPEQEKKFDDITYQHKQSLIDLHAKIQKNRLELKKLIDDGKIEEKPLLKLIDENTKLQSEIKTSSLKRWFDINNILDNEQKVTWAKMLSRITDPGVMRAGVQKMMMNRGHGMGMMQGRGKGIMQGRGMGMIQGRKMENKPVPEKQPPVQK